jgi:hypothetical protein
MSLQRVYNKETGERTYSFSEWYYKTFFWMGYGFVVYIGACLIIGIIEGISGSF